MSPERSAKDRMDQNIFSICTEPAYFLPASEVEQILSNLKHYDATSKDISQASSNAPSFGFSNTTSQQEQKSLHVRQTSHLYPVLVSEDSISIASSSFENVLKDQENEPSDGTSYAAVNSRGQSSLRSHGSNKYPHDISFRNSEELQMHVPKCIDKTPHMCDTCQKTFWKRHFLKAHLLVHSNQRPYQCKTCQKRFKAKYDFMYHQVIPSNKKSYQCDICQKKFCRKAILKHHLLVHSNERPYQCETCQKRFKKNSNLRYHQVSHSNVRPYQCEIFQTRFNRKVHLRAHQTVHSDTRQYQCEICNYRFKYKSNLNVHKRKTHMEKY